MKKYTIIKIDRTKKMKNKKRGRNLMKRAGALVQIWLVISMSIIFSVMISENVDASASMTLPSSTSSIGTGKAATDASITVTKENIGQLASRFNLPEGYKLMEGETIIGNADGTNFKITKLLGTRKNAGKDYFEKIQGSKELGFSELQKIEGTKSAQDAIGYFYDNEFMSASGKIKIDEITTAPTGWTDLKGEELYGTNQYKLTVKDPAGITHEYQTAKGAALSTAPTSGKPITAPFGWKFQGAFFIGHIAEGLMWAGVVVGAIQLLGNLFGFEQKSLNAASLAALSGIMAGKLGMAVSSQFTGGAVQGGLGGLFSWQGGLVLTFWAPAIIVGLFVFDAMYKEENKKIVSFECYPWEAPTGGANCEKCNDNLYPCSEYRCKSLGQACQLLNAGTGEEACTWVNPKDVNSPIIQTDNSVLNKDYSYKPNTAIRPPDRGVKILSKATDGCVKAFTPLSFGINVNEPSQCKIDYNRTLKFDNMQYYFGNSNIYKYNHTQTLSLPSPEALNAEVPELKADGNYNLYARCRDANGNQNDDLFVFSFCVEKGPDVTAPKIEGTSISNNMPIQFGLNETYLEVYVNEPSDCKWSRTDIVYDNMETNMSCSQHIYEMNNLMLYNCSTNLKGLEDGKDNDFYFRCKDQPLLKDSPDRNKNNKGYKFTLKGTRALNITNVKPNGTVKGTALAVVYLELTTDNGYNLGDSWCSYSLTENEIDYIQMYETNSNKHRQRLDLSSGSYTYYFQCVDLGGNAAKALTSFNIEIDISSPQVVRIYKSGDNLKIVTDEKSTCSYSNNEERECNFAIEEGTNMPYANSTEHSAEWKKQNYYVKCKDINGRQPLPTECSIVVKPQS